jgi:hypothetical protein
VVVFSAARYRALASSFWRFLDHTQRRVTVGRAPLDEWSIRRRDLYLTTHNTHNRQTSMPPVWFEPKISAGERPKTYALDRTATGTGWAICSGNVERPLHYLFVPYMKWVNDGKKSTWSYCTHGFIVSNYRIIIANSMTFFLLLSYSDVFCLPFVGVEGFVAPDHTHWHIHSVGFLWARDQPVAETSTWQHTRLTRDRHPCPRRVSNPESQQASGCRPTPQTARLAGSAVWRSLIEFEVTWWLLASS